MRVKMSKQPPPAPTASAVGPCPTVLQIVGRPGTGTSPSTIAPPDHPFKGPLNPKQPTSPCPSIIQRSRTPRNRKSETQTWIKLVGYYGFIVAKRLTSTSCTFFRQ